MWPFSKRNYQYCDFTFMHGLSNFKTNETVTIVQDDPNKSLSIFEVRGKRPPVYLPYEQITDAIIVTRQEILQSVRYVPEYVKRNIYLGDLVHTVSPKYKGPISFMVINYIPQDNPGTLEAISLGVINLSAKKFCKQLQSKLIYFEQEETTS